MVHTSVTYENQTTFQRSDIPEEERAAKGKTRKRWQCHSPLSQIDDTNPKSPKYSIRPDPKRPDFARLPHQLHLSNENYDSSHLSEVLGKI